MTSARDYMRGLQGGIDDVRWDSMALVITDLVRGFVDPDGVVVTRLLASRPATAADSADSAESGVSAVQSYLDRLASTVLPAVATLADRVRSKGGLVVHARLGGDSLDPDFMPRSVRELARLLWTRPSDATVGAAPGVPYVDGDLVVPRVAVSAFTGTALDVQLRTRGVDAVISAGVFTDGAVGSTARDAADLDYLAIVLSDGCAGLDSDLHDAALRNHARLFGPVVTHSDMLVAVSA